MMKTRRQCVAAAGSCVTISTVISFSSASDASSRHSRSELFESSAPVGSSASRIGGLNSIARAIATRCCSPPDSESGRWSARSPTSSSLSSCVLRSRSRSSSSPASSPGSSTFSRAVSVETRLNC